MLQTILPAAAILLGTGYLLWALTRARRRGISGWALVLALAAMVCLEGFDLLVLLRPAEIEIWRRGGLLAEALMPPLWLLYALTFGRDGGLRNTSTSARLMLALSPVFLLAALLFPFEKFFLRSVFATEGVLFLGNPGFFFSVGLLLFLTFCLVQLEHTLSSTPPHQRWAGKFELLGVATLLVGQLIYLSQGLLHRTLDMDLLPVRSLALAAGLVLIGYSRLRRGEPVPVRVSPEMAFRSVVVLVAGIYLIGLGVVGEGMQYLQASGRRTILLCIGLTGGVALAIVFLSETAKRKIRVFLHKHFYEKKYDYREQWQRFTRQLSLARSQEELFGAILDFYREIFAVQGAALFLRDPEQGTYRIEAVCGIDLVDATFGGGTPLVRALEKEEWVLAAEDGKHGVPSEIADKVSFIVPLLFDRTLEGFIFLGPRLDRREETTYEDFDLMKMLARQAASTILSVRLADQLACSRELAAMGKVSAFVLHDLKNLTSGLSLVVDNARHYLDDADFRDDMLATLGITVGRMKELIARLQNLEEKPGLDLRVCDLRDVIDVRGMLGGAGAVLYQGGSAIARIDPEEMQKVALNLILNALEAGKGRPVRVETGEDGRAFFRVRDQGCGMSEEFIRNRLFRPFQTTKKKGFGIGLYQCKSIIEAHGGGIEVRSEEGKGTEFTVWLPGADQGRGETMPEADGADSPQRKSKVG